MGLYEGLALELKDQVIAELKQALAEKDRQIAHLKERVAHYDRWLSIGVYYTNEEFFERVLKPKQQLMEKAVRFAELAGVRSACKEAYDFLQSTEVQAWKERQS